ncbi:MAG: hypothetical protein ACK47C_07815 [Paracoccaceae bacterium]
MAVGFCYRSGEIDTAPSLFPEGTIPFVRSRKGPAKLKEIIGVKARHAYDGKTLLVPGIPEAADDQAAIDALDKWKAWAFPEGRV